MKASDPSETGHKKVRPVISQLPVLREFPGQDARSQLELS